MSGTNGSGATGVDTGVWYSSGYTPPVSTYGGPRPNVSGPALRTEFIPFRSQS
jgi:hypothetical protein